MAMYSREPAAESADVYAALDVLAAQLAAGVAVSPVTAEQQHFSAFYHS